MVGEGAAGASSALANANGQPANTSTPPVATTSTMPTAQKAPGVKATA